MPREMYFIFAVALFSIVVIRRVMPVQTFCSVMNIRSEILQALWLAAYLVTGLASLHIEFLCALLIAVSFGFTLIISRAIQNRDDDAQRLFPVLSSLVTRAPPVS